MALSRIIIEILKMRKIALLFGIIIFSFACISKAHENEQRQSKASSKPSIQINPEDECKGNHFLFLSTFVLGRQQDLTLTIDQINKTASIDEVTFSDQPYRTYRIFNITQTISYLQSRQHPELLGQNVLRITNGTIRVNFNFLWEKTQLGTSLYGNGTGTVGSDVLTYQKTLTTNSSHQLQWHLSRVEPITITNGLSLSKMQPYKAQDYEILSNMLNKLSNGTTVKQNLITILNKNYQKILAEKVLIDKTLSFDKVITYSYLDYRGPFELSYSQTLLNSTLAADGLYLLFNQIIIGDDQFQCGQPVPQVPDDPVFGGLQQFISNSLIKSTLKYALKKGFLDVVLSQQFWQSRAFQFFMGDVQEVMPKSTKNMSTLIQLSGRCNGLNDPAFSFAAKSSTSYDLKVNFQCQINFSKTKLVGVNILVSYEVAPQLSSKYLDFMLKSISGTPVFVQTGTYKIEYPELAEFMVQETLALAKGDLVIGSQYKAVNRKFPGLWVKNNYLFLYDSSAKPKGLFTQ